MCTYAHIVSVGWLLFVGVFGGVSVCGKCKHYIFVIVRGCECMRACCYHVQICMYIHVCIYVYLFVGTHIQTNTAYVHRHTQINMHRRTCSW